jgi:hypothetical protein
MPKKKKRKGYDVTFNPDGVDVIFPYNDFVIGSSVFIPCVNTTKANAQVRKLCKTAKIGAKTSIVVENGRYGIRVWRTM